MDCSGYDGYGGLGFGSGDGAWELATTSKGGSRHETYPMFIERGSDGKYKYRVPLKGFFNLNEYNVNKLTRINWRASLVPAAAVIPAPIAYIIVVAVKKFVVGF